MRLQRTRKSEAGMSLLEVMIAGVVLITGLLVGVLPMITYGVTTMRASDEETIAKQKGRQIMESIYGARATQLGWDSVKMTSDPCTTNGTSVVCGVFVPNPQPMYAAGNDGIMGTADDADAGIESTVMANGQVRTLSEFKREIKIKPYTDADGNDVPTLRQIIVDITYPYGNGLKRTYEIKGLISQYK